VTGAKVVSQVYMKEDLFEGPFAERAPDIYAAAAPTYEIVGYSPEGEVFLPPFRSGTHSEEGIIICKGPDFREGHEIDGASIMDVAPTILHLMGLGVPSHADGKVLTHILREGSEPATRSVARESGQDEQWRVRRRVDGLKRSGRV
jgi:predicted AlkP superfamily phosphohydrolase/phosphomutase